MRRNSSNHTQPVKRIRFRHNYHRRNLAPVVSALLRPIRFNPLAHACESSGDNMNARDSINIVLLCLVCVLGTYVYVTDRPSCKCDQSSVLKRLDDLDSKLSKRIGSPAGSPVGSPEE